MTDNKDLLSSYNKKCDQLKDCVQYNSRLCELLDEATKKISKLEFQNNSLADRYIDALHDDDKMAMIRDELLMAEDRILELEKDLASSNQRILNQVTTIVQLQNEIRALKLEKEPAEIPMTPMSCTPGWGQLGFLDPDKGYEPITRVKTTNVKITSNDLNSGYTDGVLDGRDYSYQESPVSHEWNPDKHPVRWDDYNTAG